MGDQRPVYPIKIWKSFFFWLWLYYSIISLECFKTRNTPNFYFKKPYVNYFVNLKKKIVPSIGCRVGALSWRAMKKTGGDTSTWRCPFPHPLPAHHEENGLWSLRSSCAAAFHRKRIRAQGAVLWSPVHATVSGTCGFPTPRSLSSRIATGPESHLYTHCLREQLMPPMSSCAKTARHLGSTALSIGRHQCAVDPI